MSNPTSSVLSLTGTHNKHCMAVGCSARATFVVRFVDSTYLCDLCGFTVLSALHKVIYRDLFLLQEQREEIRVIPQAENIGLPNKL